MGDDGGESDDATRRRSVTQIGSQGRWRVTTETALYGIDLDHAWVCRHPSPTPDSGNQYPGMQAAVLRSDGRPIPLIAVVLCQLGKPMILVLDLRGDGVVTVRQSTSVRAIEPEG